MKYLGLVLLCLAVGCQSPNQQYKNIEKISLGVTYEDAYPNLLSKWPFFQKEMHNITGSQNLLPYEVNAPLFSNYAYKKRAIFLPNATNFSYHKSETFDFPIGTVLIKTFYYPSDFQSPKSHIQIIETRLLIKTETQWDAIVYQWDSLLNDGKRILTGATQPIQWQDEKGIIKKVNYRIPSQPQCKSCHEFNGKIMPIGTTARQLNHENQLYEWKESKKLVNLPADIPFLPHYFDSTYSINVRARSWLEVNCAHCHRLEGPAKNTGLFLLTSETDPYRLGINKPPIAAGRGSGGYPYSIVAGNPNRSIMVHRITSQDIGVMMPELGREMVHEEGVNLIKNWIAEMDSQQ